MLKGPGWGWGAGLPELAPPLPSISTCRSIYNLLVSHKELRGASFNPAPTEIRDDVRAALDLVIG